MPKRARKKRVLPNRVLPCPGIWKLRDGSEIRIVPDDHDKKDTKYDYILGESYVIWDDKGMHIRDSRKDLMERKREALIR